MIRNRETNSNPVSDQISSDPATTITTISKRTRLNTFDNLLQVSRNVTNALKSSTRNDWHFLIVVAIVVISGFVEAIKDRNGLII